MIQQSELAEPNKPFYTHNKKKLQDQISFDSFKRNVLVVIVGRQGA
jgi:hypothetical protein